MPLRKLGAKRPHAVAIHVAVGIRVGCSEESGSSGDMIDPYGRHITYLRVSVTDRCDFRCVYCMPEHMTFLPKAEILTLEELDRMCSAFVGLGVRKLRITGGEPLVRRNVMSPGMQ